MRRYLRLYHTPQLVNRMGNFGGTEGYLFSVCAIAIAAAESAVAIAIMINIYRMLKGIQVDKLEKMKG